MSSACCNVTVGSLGPPRVCICMVLLNLEWHCILVVNYNKIRELTIPGPRFNIKMSSYQCRKSHCGDKTIIRSSYLHNGISYTGKMTSLYWIRSPFCDKILSCYPPCNEVEGGYTGFTLFVRLSLRMSAISVRMITRILFIGFNFFFCICITWVQILDGIECGCHTSLNMCIMANLVT